MNTIGQLFRVSSFGESHGSAVGVMIDGCPPGVAIDTETVALWLRRRRPGQNALVTERKEEDLPEIISGVFEGKSTGAPIVILIRNRDTKSADYDHLKHVYRPGHADFTYDQKYGIRDHRGGGRSSARITAGWVAAGAIASAVLQQHGLTITAWADAIGPFALDGTRKNYTADEVEASSVRCPVPEISARMEAAIAAAREQKDSLGGIVACRISNCSAGLGEPVFGKLPAALAHAMLNINATKGFEMGDGFAMSARKGSEMNDGMRSGPEGAVFSSNHSGGVLGGISNGNDIFFRVAFKPVSSIGMTQETITDEGQNTEIEVSGRHDPCVVPRAVPIVEAMAALVILDFMLLQNRFRF